MTDSINDKTWMFWLALLALVAGLGAGLWSLLAPLGVWLGLWEFGRGFQILGGIVPFSGYVALGSLAAAVIVFVSGTILHHPRVRTLFTFAVIGTLSATIAWYIPNSFRAPAGESYPPIHDVSTDTENPPRYVAVMPLRAEAPNTTVYGGSPNMTPQRNAQLQREAFPDLVPKLLEASPQEVFDRALNAVDEMGWELVAAVPEAGRIEATATTFWFRFKDDVVIRIQPEGTNQTRIDARSLSRVGGGDAGTNGKRLREFFSIL